MQVKVYQHSSYGKGTLLVSPGASHRERREWFGPNGEPISYTVKFNGGVAEVEADLARFLIQHGHAYREPRGTPRVDPSEAPLLAAKAFAAPEQLAVFERVMGLGAK
jgi:hypothetical protein